MQEHPECPGDTDRLDDATNPGTSRDSRGADHEGVRVRDVGVEEVVDEGDSDRSDECSGPASNDVGSSQVRLLS